MQTENKLFEYEIKDGTLEIKLVGEIDHHSAVRVRTEMDELIFSTMPKKMILNLSEISFMDSSGLGLIMGRYSKLVEIGATMSLRSPTVAVMRILSLAGMERMIKIEKVNWEE